MKYFAWIVFIGACVFCACRKTNNTTTSVLFYNGTWSLSAISAAWNGTDIIATPIAQGQSSVTPDSAYIQVQAGTNLVTLKSGSTTLLDKNIYTAAATGSSFIFFDTSATVTAPVRILQLTDDLTKPDTGRIKYRIINLVPDTTIKVDTWLVNGTADSARLDSSATFIGKNATADVVQGFSAQPYYASSYTIKVKKSGTETVYASINQYPFVLQNTYSIIFSGLLTGTGSTGFKLSVLHHHIP